MKTQAVTLLTVFAALAALSLPAQAQSERTGLSYTTRGAAPAKESELRTISYDNRNEPEKEEQEGAESPGDRSWEKYKELAAGTFEKEKEEKAKQEKTEKKAEKQSSSPPTGFAGILEQYRKNKEIRSEMKTITVTKPEKPEKPDVEKPEAAKMEKAD